MNQQQGMLLALAWPLLIGSVLLPKADAGTGALSGSETPLQDTLRPFRSDGIDLSDHASITDARLYLVGEFHLAKTNAAVEHAIFSTVHRKYGVNDIIVEEGPATTYLLNNYLSSGQTFLLDQCVIYPNVRRYFYTLRKLMEQTRMFPPLLHSADYEDRASNILLALDHYALTPNVQVPEWLSPIEAWRAKGMRQRITSDRESVVYLDQMQVKYDELVRAGQFVGDPILIDLFGSYASYGRMKQTDFNSCTDPKAIEQRERYMQDRVAALLKDTSKKYLGIFGAMHVPATEQGPDFLFRCPEAWSSMTHRLIATGVLKKEETLILQIVIKDAVLCRQLETVLGLDQEQLSNQFRRFNCKKEVAVWDLKAQGPERTYPYDLLILTK
jgi:hypothetical protein